MDVSKYNPVGFLLCFGIGMCFPTSFYSELLPPYIQQCCRFLHNLFCIGRIKVCIIVDCFYVYDGWEFSVGWFYSFLERNYFSKSEKVLFRFVNGLLTIYWTAFFLLFLIFDELFINRRHLVIHIKWNLKAMK